MSMKKISATFIGQDGSLGYRKDNTYILFIREINEFPIFIQDINDRKECPYQSIIAFLNNWTNIKVIN